MSAQDALEIIAETASVEAILTAENLKNVRRNLTDYRAELSAALLAITKDDKSVAEVFQAERHFMIAEREHLAGDSKDAISSLDNGLTELTAAEKILEVLLHDQNDYRSYARKFTLAKNLINGLPKDEARQFFRSHLTRLGNLKRGRLSDAERHLLDCRISAILEAERQYKKLQEKALGIAEEPARYHVQEQVALAPNQVSTNASPSPGAAAA